MTLVLKDWKLEDLTENMSNVCKFNQSGYCKYGNRCRFLHNDQVCELNTCEREGCEKRHPRQCTYYHRRGYCKFKDYCKYSHKEDNNSVKMNQIEQKVRNLVDNNNIKDLEIQKLKEHMNTLSEKINSLESKMEFLEAMKTPEQFIEKSKSIICEQCEKSFNSEKGLRLHIRKVHKESLSEDLPQLDGNLSIISEDGREPELKNLVKEDNFDDDKTLKDNESACLDLKIVSSSYEEAKETVSSNIKRLARFNFEISSYKDDEQNEHPYTTYIFFSEIENSDISHVNVKEFSEGWINNYPNTELTEIRFRRIVH